jgi:isohexenylglutaconyl-CoA hydratase
VSDGSCVRVQRDDALPGVLRVTLARPEVRNAMSLAMVRELREALANAEADGTTRVLVLRGAGGHFCSGGDIRDMAAARGRLAGDPNALTQTSAAFGELCVAYAGTGLMTVAVLEGAVMGGGFGLACVCDIAIASDSVDFRLPEVTLGLVPAQIAAFLVERIGYAEAKRLAISGARLDSATALRLRLVHEVHPAEGLDEMLPIALRRLLHAAPQAVAATKALLARARAEAPASLVGHAAELFSRAVLGAEGTEGTLAFVQKRKASWMPAEPQS